MGSGTRTAINVDIFIGRKNIGVFGQEVLESSKGNGFSIAEFSVLRFSEISNVDDELLFLIVNKISGFD